jgi:hypothetical protein
MQYWHILNLSDNQAKISDFEKNTWLQYLKSKEVDYIFSEENLVEITRNLDAFNKLAGNGLRNTILATSWWFESINYFNSLDAKITGWLNFLWFSDLLHLMYRYYDCINVLCIYGLTLRNISELSEKEWGQLTVLLESGKFTEKLDIVGNINNGDGRVHGWHILIFINMILLQKIEIKDCYLYLEFHWLDERLIIYYIDFLNTLWLFQKNKWIIISFVWCSLEEGIITGRILRYTNNLYISRSAFFPLFKQITITQWNLML